MGPVCQRCHELIFGSYIEALGHCWHREHFICAVCRQPIEDNTFHERHGKPYHVDCYTYVFSVRCDYCRKPLSGRYLTDHWGTNFCPEHEQEFETCAYCGCLAPDYPAGNSSTGKLVRCRACKSRAIETFVQAEPIFYTLVHWINKQGLSFNNLDLRIKLSGPTQLEKTLGYNNPRVLGVASRSTHVFDNQSPKTTVIGVTILRGLPSGLFQGVTIHELGHAWLGVHQIVGLSDWAEEGFCELLAYRYYRSCPNPINRFYADRLEKNGDRVYGDGFRELARITHKLGFGRVLATLQSDKTLPIVP